MQGKGYWAKGSRIYPIDIHIRYIIKHPDKFDLTTDFIKSVYKKFKEPMGFEGKARNEIMKKVMSKGWLRVRHNRGRSDHWSIQFDDYNKRKSLVKSFIKKMFMDEIGQYDDLALSGVEDGYFEKISADKFLKEYTEINEYDMILEDEEEHLSFIDVLDDLS